MISKFGENSTFICNIKYKLRMVLNYNTQKLPWQRFNNIYLIKLLLNEIRKYDLWT